MYLMLSRRVDVQITGSLGLPNWLQKEVLKWPDIAFLQGTRVGDADTSKFVL